MNSSPEFDARTRVGFLTHTASFGGAEHSLRDLVVGVAAQDIDPIVYLPSQGPLWTRLANDGIPCREISWPLAVHAFGDSPDLPQQRSARQLAVLPGQMWRLCAQLRRLFQRDRLQVLHTNSIKAEVAAGFVGAGPPRVWYAKEAVWRRPVARRLLPWLPVRPRQVWACSQAVQSDLGRISARFRRMSEVVYNPFDLSPFPPQPDRSDDLPAAPQGGLRIGVVAALTPLKGHDLFLDAAATLLRQWPTLAFYIVGDDFAGNRGEARAAYAVAIKQRAAESDLGGRVFFTGARTDVPRVLASLDICVQASVLPDAYPRSVLEPLALGRVVVGPNEGGVPEILGQVSSDLLYKPRSVEDLCRALRPLIADGDLRRRQAAAGAAFMQQRYQEPHFAREAAARYRRLAAPPR